MSLTLRKYLSSLSNMSSTDPRNANSFLRPPQGFLPVQRNARVFDVWYHACTVRLREGSDLIVPCLLALVCRKLVRVRTGEYGNQQQNDRH